ncbi:MAG: class I SAM-dependent methyltransferase [Candidatus Thermoplasmatota archaeon]
MVDIEEWARHQERIFTNERFGVASIRDITCVMGLLGKPPKKVLDMGCNDGGVVKKLRELGFEAYGVDLASVTDKAKAKYPEIKNYLYPLNLETEVAEDFKNKFDFILAFEVIEHLINDQKFLNDIYLYLKEGGFFYLTTRSDKTPVSVERAHFRHYSIQDLRKKVESSKLKVEELREEDGLFLIGKKV